MTDGNRILGRGAFGPEPARDDTLGALLREGVGSVPMDAVDWSALADSISARVAAHAVSPWWTYAARWERRVIPIALAAGIAATFALLRLDVPTTPTFVSAASVSTDVVSGAPIEDAAVQFARSVTVVGDVTAGIPE